MYVVDKAKLVDFRRLAKNMVDCRSMTSCNRCAREIREECQALGGLESKDEQYLLWFRYILNKLEELDKNLLDVSDEEFLKILG